MRSAGHAHCTDTHIKTVKSHRGTYKCKCAGDNPMQWTADASCTAKMHGLCSPKGIKYGSRGFPGSPHDGCLAKHSDCLEYCILSVGSPQPASMTVCTLHASRKAAIPLWLRCRTTRHTCTPLNRLYDQSPSANCSLCWGFKRTSHGAPSSSQSLYRRDLAPVGVWLRPAFRAPSRA